MEKTVEDYLQLFLALLIFALLGFVVFRSMRKEEVQEAVEELSVEKLIPHFTNFRPSAV